MSLIDSRVFNMGSHRSTRYPHLLKCSHSSKISLNNYKINHHSSNFLRHNRFRYLNNSNRLLKNKSPPNNNFRYLNNLKSLNNKISCSP